MAEFYGAVVDPATRGLPRAVNKEKPGEQDREVGTGLLDRGFNPGGYVRYEPVGVGVPSHPLLHILHRAYEFAVLGKGLERHGKSGKPWAQQRHAEIGRELGVGFALGQAVKKAYESQGLEPEAAVRELLGAITYLGSAVFILEEQERVRKERNSSD